MDISSVSNNSVSNMGKKVMPEPVGVNLSFMSDKNEGNKSANLSIFGQEEEQEIPNDLSFFSVSDRKEDD